VTCQQRLSIFPEWTQGEENVYLLECPAIKYNTDCFKYVFTQLKRKLNFNTSIYYLFLWSSAILLGYFTMQKTPFHLFWLAYN